MEKVKTRTSSVKPAEKFDKTDEKRMEKQGPKLVVAPRAGFEPATNRLTANPVPVSARLIKVHPDSYYATVACTSCFIVYYCVSSDNIKAHQKCCLNVV